MGYTRRMPSRLNTVVETAPYIRDAQRIMTRDEQKAVIDLLATNPLAGVLVPDGGGIRKVRMPLDGRGKRGGARVIYFFQTADHPVFLLACFAKNEKADLTVAERRALAAAVKLWIRS